MYANRESARSVSDSELNAALAEANMPTLLVVLSHLTGDRSWLRPPYAVGRSKGLDDNDSGDLPEDVGAEVRLAAFRAIREWCAGNLPDPGRPDDEAMQALMSAQAGEPVGAEFADMVAEELGLADRWARSVTTAQASVDLDALIVGAGLGGIAAGVRLGASGIEYRMVEKNAAPGGSWFENTYPGAGVDTPSHMYSYSFAQSGEWSRYYAKQEEIQEYVVSCARTYGVDRHIDYETTATSAEFDESTCRWVVDLVRADGSVERVTPRILISAVGQLNVPKIPDYPGRESFKGPQFHSARWPAGLDVSGKKVAVVGSGASAMQMVPILADQVEELLIFQRSQQWAGPNANYFRETTSGARLLFSVVPLYLEWYRFRLFWMFNDRVYQALQIDPDWPHPERSVNAVNDKHRIFLTDYIIKELGDRQDLLPKVLPDYPPFGKRMLIDNGWYRTLTKPNVRLISEGIEEFAPSSVRTATGEDVDVDIVVYSTGFETLRLLESLEVRGLNGQLLREAWGDDDGFAYLGIAAPGFPNFFCVYGPNTNLGHGGSIILNTECQVRYIGDLLDRMIANDVVMVDCRAEVCEEYVKQVDDAHSRMIWSHPGFTSWYRNSQGRVVTNSPWRLVDYWRMTRIADLGDYHVRTRTDASGPA